jgi:hypothetical protein
MWVFKVAAGGEQDLRQLASTTDGFSRKCGRETKRLTTHREYNEIVSIS